MRIKRYIIAVVLLGAVLSGAPSCKKAPVEEKDAFTVALSFKASPTLSQSIPSRFRVSFFTDGVQTAVRDIESVKIMNEGFLFDVVRGTEFELSAVYGWPYGTEWYQNGSIAIPYGWMMPSAGGAYIKEAFPSDKEAHIPFGLEFRKLYYEFPVIIEGEEGVKYTVSFDCKVAGFSWPELEPLPGHYHYEIEIDGKGHDTVRIPVIDDNAVMDLSVTGRDADGVVVYGPEKEMCLGSVVSGKNGEVFSVIKRIG